MEHFLTREISLSPVPHMRDRAKLALEDAVIHQVFLLTEAHLQCFFPSLGGDEVLDSDIGFSLLHDGVIGAF